MKLKATTKNISPKHHLQIALFFTKHEIHILGQNKMGLKKRKKLALMQS